MGDLSLWERQPWDTDASFARFHEYYLLQARPRSVDRAYRVYFASTRGLQISDDQVRSKRAPGLWQCWSRGENSKAKRKEIGGQPVPTWADRARAYDDHLAEQDRFLWEQRRAEVREQDWDDANKLRALAHQILEQALIFDGKTRLVKGDDGQPDQIVKTVKLQGNLAVQALKLASELQRLSAEMATQIAEHTVHIPLNADEMARRREMAQERARQYEEDLLNDDGTDGDGDAD